MSDEEKDAYNFHSEGLHCYQTIDYPYAVDYFKKALDLNPEMYEALLYYGASFYAMEKYYKAIEIYEGALKLFPNNQQILNNLAVFFKRNWAA